jgi:hypothetical protein
MNPEQQRIKIAEACGWLSVSYSSTWRDVIGVTDDNDTCFDYEIVPDYPNDLNAMHEAEKVLTYEQFDDYYIELAKRMVRPFQATAAQRAEAFLRTLNLWEE